MINSAQAVKDKLKYLVKVKNIDFNSALRFYMYDRFIERLSKSEYRDNFIIKGGFHLSALFGIDNRSTMDIDTVLKNISLNEENIVNIINEILSIKVDDNVKFKVSKISQIRTDDKYGGIRVTINFNLDNINDSFHIDMAVGDSIYPGPTIFGYKSFINDKIYNIWTYSIENILAEKIETIFSKLETSSRQKDYYDIYLIYKFCFDTLNRDNFKNAVFKTFEKRKFNNDLLICLNIVRNSSILREKWKSYSRKNSYAKNIQYEDTIECLEEFIDILVSTKV